MTILQGDVSEEKTTILISNYKNALKQKESGMLKTFLVQDIKTPVVWKIITIWENKEVLEKMRSLGTPKGVLIFRSAGTEPSLSINEINESLES